MDGAKRKSGAGGTIESFFGAPTKRSKSSGGGDAAGPGAAAAPAEAGAAPAAHTDVPAAAEEEGGGGAGGSGGADAAESSLTVRLLRHPSALHRLRKQSFARSSVTPRLRSRTRDTVTPARRWSVGVWA
jgi:hypothetical protein